MEFIHQTKEIPVIKEVDVAVVGAGPAGVAAAVCAARNGAKTLLIERFPSFGGMFTQSLVIWLPIDKLVPLRAYGDTRSIQSGFISELVSRLKEKGGCYDPQGVLENCPIPLMSIYTQTDQEIAKIVLQEMIEEANVDVMLHTLFVDTIVENNTVKGVIVENKSGRQAIRAKVVIDCSGDADVVASAGAKYEKSDEPLKMSLQAVFAGLDEERAEKYSSPEGFMEFMGFVKQALERGEIKASEVGFNLGGQKETAAMAALPITPMNILKKDSYPENWFRRGAAYGWVGNYAGDATSAEELTKAELSTRRNLYSIVSFFRKYVPGYEKCYLDSTATTVGIRESRRLVGEYQISFAKENTEGTRHRDVVTKCRTATLNIKDYTPEKAPTFDIPYRCLVPEKMDGLLVAGRCISVDHALASALSPRDVSTCFCLGQAAGTAAALSAREGVTPRTLDTELLLHTLSAQGANVDYEG